MERKTESKQLVTLDYSSLCDLWTKVNWLRIYAINVESHGHCLLARGESLKTLPHYVKGKTKEEVSELAFEHLKKDIEKLSEKTEDIRRLIVEFKTAECEPAYGGFA
jgi:hypothetical protein